MAPDVVNNVLNNCAKNNKICYNGYWYLL